MAVCEKCGKETREGQIYCEDCLAVIEDYSFDDLFESLGSDSDADEAEDDFTKILDELQGSHEEIPEDDSDKKTASSHSTVSEVFSDAVSAISSLEDELEDMIDLGQVEESEEKKRGFFARLFHRKSKEEKVDITDDDSVMDKKALKRAEKEKKKEEKLRLAKEKEEAAKKAAQEKEEAKEAKKKEAKQKKEESKKTKKKDAKEKKAKEKKPKEKKPKKEKVKKPKNEVEGDVIEEDLGHFNIPVMIALFVIFIGGLGYLIPRAFSVSYQFSIQTAERKFERQHYNEAFDEIYGLKIKKNDAELYDKIVTVMYVNKQLNSYNNYMELEMYPEALDSLIKGLKRYDVYIDSAKELGIQEDLDYVREQILKVLKREFGLSKKKAEKLMKIESQTEYSLKIYDIVNKHNRSLDS